jgi:hypothetical protein
MTTSANKPQSFQDDKADTVDIDCLWDDNKGETTSPSNQYAAENDQIDGPADHQAFSQYIPTPPKDELFIEPVAPPSDLTEQSNTPTPLPKKNNHSKAEASQDSEADVIGSHDQAGFAKKVIRTSSWKAFYIHFGVALFFIAIAQFPSLPLMLFSQQDLNAIPENIVSNLPNIIMIACYALSLLLIFLAFKQKQTGSLHIYSDYVVYKKAMFDKGITVHFNDIRTIDVHSCFATMYNDIGDFHLISQKDHIIIKNMYQPFLLKDKINHVKMKKN